MSANSLYYYAMLYKDSLYYSTLNRGGRIFLVALHVLKEPDENVSAKNST